MHLIPTHGKLEQLWLLHCTTCPQVEKFKCWVMCYTIHTKFLYSLSKEDIVSFVLLLGGNQIKIPVTYNTTVREQQ